MVVTVPPALALDIAFEPALPDDRRELYRLAVGGKETKTLLVYDEPFWRAEGFSGQSVRARVGSRGHDRRDPGVRSPGVLASFTFGRVAEQFDALDAPERRRGRSTRCRSRLGPRAGSPAAFVETPWWTEEWTRGCSMAHLPPGALTRYGRLLREPLGRVHWAGTETATRSHGAIDGAVRSGERAAAEILDRS